MLFCMSLLVRGGQFKQVLCDGLWVNFDAVFSAFSDGLFFQMYYIVLIFIGRLHHNFHEIAVKICKK